MLSKNDKFMDLDPSEQCTAWKFKILADLSFFLSLKYSEFWIFFLQTIRSNNYLYQDFFPDFFEISKSHFRIFKKKTSIEL
jgi:hypothetical protein